MASTQTRPNRLLAELLQEDQEPFVHLSKSKRVSFPCSKLLKSLCKKLILIHKSFRISKPVMEPQILSLYDDQDPTSLLPSHSCNLKKDEPTTHTRSQQKGSKFHLSSVNTLVCSLVNLHLLLVVNCDNSAKTQQENKSAPRMFKAKKVTQESILSASLWELLVSSTSTRESIGVHQFKAKRVLQQNKQLLFDCVREVIEKHGTRRGGEALGSEEIGSLICHKIKEWGNQSSMEQLLDVDFQEWNDFKVHKKELAMAIGDDILEELGKQLVTDMLHSQMQTHF